MIINKKSSTYKEIYNYKLWSKVKIFISFVVFLIGLLFSLNFYAESNLPDGSKSYDFNFEEKNLIVTFFLLPISVLSLIVSIIYANEYLSTFEVTNNYIKKKKFFGSFIIINLTELQDLISHKLVLYTKIIDNNGISMNIIPSLKNYNILITFLYNKFTDEKEKQIIENKD